MSQQHLQQQQQAGSRVGPDHDLRGTTSYPFRSAADPAQIDELLTHDQLARVEMLNAARDLVLTVTDRGRETRVDTTELITVASYIESGFGRMALTGTRSIG